MRLSDLTDEQKWKNIVGGIRSAFATPKMAASSMIEFMELVREQLSSGGGVAPAVKESADIKLMKEKIASLETTVAKLEAFASDVQLKTSATELNVATDAVDMTQAAIVATAADTSSIDPFENAATTESAPEVSTESEAPKPTSKKRSSASKE